MGACSLDWRYEEDINETSLQNFLVRKMIDNKILFNIGWLNPDSSITALLYNSIHSTKYK